MPKPKDPKAADTIVLQGDYRLYLFQHRKKLHYLTSSSGIWHISLITHFHFPLTAWDFISQYQIPTGFMVY